MQLANTNCLFTYRQFIFNELGTRFGVFMTSLIDYLGSKKEEVEEVLKKQEESRKQLLDEERKNTLQNINFEGFEGKLDLLVDGIRKIPNYNNLKGYIRQNILPKNPGIDYKNLSSLAGVHKGVALVILYDLYNDKLEAELKSIDKDDYSIPTDL